jgi:ribosomal-protein-alanine N-acetyltransferase
MGNGLGNGVVRMVEAEIREIRGREDLDAIKTIESLSGLHERDWEQYLCTFDKSMGKTFVCVVQGEVVGKVELMMGEEKGEYVGYVRRLAVHPNHREKGYAKKLMNHMLNFAKEKGIKTLDLHVTESNKPAIRLYESLGFYVRHKEIHLRKDIMISPP